MAMNQYLYGIIEEPQKKRFKLQGIEDAGVYTINFNGLAAVVSDTQLGVLDPTRKNVRAHVTVQDEVLKDYCILPMGFGIVAEGESRVIKMLSENHDGLCAEIRRLAGKVEAGLKVFWDQEAMVKQLQGENVELDRLKERIRRASSPFESQRILIEAGKMVESMAQDWKFKYAERIYAALKQLALEARMNNPIGVKNILNASFLVDRSHVFEFQQQVYRLDESFKGRMDFKYIGPLPPYSFVNLRLEAVK